MNPYWGKNFFTFFVVLIKRLFGQIPLKELPSDEIQLLVLIGISLSCALVGTFLMLKKMTMLANSLSHTILLGIVLSYLITFSFSPDLEISLPTLLLGSVLAGVLTTVLSQVMTSVVKLQEDASIGLVFTTLFAIGIVLVTVFTKNVHLGTEIIMGNADALHPDDVKMAFFTLLAVCAIITLLFRPLKLSAFDPVFAQAIGLKIHLIDLLLMIITAGAAISAFRAVGVLLVLAFLVGPPLIARQLTNHLGKLMIYACGFGFFLALASVALSRHLLSVHHMPLSTPASPSRPPRTC